MRSVAAACGALLALLLSAAPAAAQDRYELANGCFMPWQSGGTVGKDGDGYRTGGAARGVPDAGHRRSASTSSTVARGLPGGGLRPDRPGRRAEPGRRLARRRRWERARSRLFSLGAGKYLGVGGVG